MKTRNFRVGLTVFLIIAALTGFLIILCLVENQPKTIAKALPSITQPQSNEVAVIEIPISGSLVSPRSEISGLAFFNQTLLILPQYPRRMLPPGDSYADGYLFAIHQQDLLDYISDTKHEPIAPREIPLYTGGLEEDIPGFEGYEAIGFDGNHFYLAIEARQMNKMMAYLVAGEITPDLSSFRLDPDSLTENPLQQNQDNRSNEALLIHDQRVISIHEINGEKINPEPRAAVFNKSLLPEQSIPFPNIEYRITDATAVDEQGVFWVINYFYPGDMDLIPQNDPIANQYPKGATHAGSEIVERLVQFKITADRISMTEAEPLWLQLRPDGKARNWEGIAWLSGSGFFLATDQYPQTILGFVRYPVK